MKDHHKKRIDLLTGHLNAELADVVGLEKEELKKAVLDVLAVAADVVNDTLAVDVEKYEFDSLSVDAAAADVVMLQRFVAVVAIVAVEVADGVEYCLSGIEQTL